MDQFSDPALGLKYKKCKFKVKKWEKEFRDINGTDPSKDDIKEAPAQIREAYKWYWRLKIHALGQDSLKFSTFLDNSYINQISDEFILPSEQGCTTVDGDGFDKNFSRAENRPVPCSEPSMSTDVELYSSIEPSVHAEEPIKTVQDFSSRKAQADVQICANGNQCNLKTTLQSSPEPSSKDKTNVEKTILPEPNQTNAFDNHSNTKTSSVPPVSHSLQALSKDKMCSEQSNSPGISPGEDNCRIWGQHLNNSKTKDNKSAKLSLQRSSSFQLAEKLFHGSKFKKRNPRKSLSSLSLKTKSMSSIPSSENVVQSNNLASQNSEEDGFPINVLKNDAASSFFTSNFVVTKSHVTPSAQPISAVQKLLENNVLGEKPKMERQLDKGWIDRVSAANELPDFITFKKDIVPLNDYPNNESKGMSNVSDDDIIYDSDTDSKEIDQKSRFALLPKVNAEILNRSMNCSIGEGKTEDEKPDLLIRKRKADAVDAAIAVLSERQLRDTNTAPGGKRQRKSSVSFSTNEEMQLSDNHVSWGKSTRDKTSSANKKVSNTSVLKKQVARGSVNDNFIRINIKKKVFVRGKKTMNFQKYKKQQWKKKKSEVASEANAAYASRRDPSDGAAGGGLAKCFNCDEIGHFARACPKSKGDSLLPNDEVDEDESPFPSLAEVEKMAQERISSFARKAIQTHSGDTHILMPGSSEFLSDEFEHRDKKIDHNELVKESDQLVVNHTYMFKEKVDDLPSNCESARPLYSLNSDGSLLETPPEVHEILHMFGHQNFRPGQEKAIMRVLSGLSTLVTLSTGSGKSLCYQIPAYLYAKHKNCITLVISPLVSLMDDQVTGLPSFIKAAALHTGLTEKQKEKVIEMIRSGKLQILLLSPEAVVAGQKQTGFGGILNELPDVAFACIDEVHCLSQWSHNFRPSYLMLCKVLREKLKVKTILGLTATATKITIQSIISLLNIPDGHQGVIQDIPLPNNILLTVSRDSNRDQAVLELLGSNSFQSFNSIIIYCTRREECERLSTLLRTCLKDTSTPNSSQNRLSSVAEAYHAGLSSSRRKQVQNAFMSGKLRIVVATVAFGMGINKSNIRAVIHFNMPKTFESYVQEVGRAGRDGEFSHCHLFLEGKGKDLPELRRHIFGESVDRHTIRKLLQRVFIPCKCLEKSSISKDTEDAESCLDKPQDLSSSVGQINGTSTSNPSGLHAVSPCGGHEVAFSIESTVEALDLPEENILTLLCYLELHDKHLIRVLPKTYTHCKVRSYRGMKHIHHIARACPPLAMAVAINIMNDKNEHGTNNTLEFPVIDIANSIGWDSGVVKRELINLEWTKAADHTKRSGLKIELSDLGFHVRAPGNLSPEQMDAALDFLHQRVGEQEESSLQQLNLIFSALSRVSFSDIHLMMASKNIQQHSEDLKQIIRDYFLEDHFSAKGMDMDRENFLENSDQVASDIRQLVNSYRDCSFTGRAVARIFHGIGSPNFPPQVWGRCRFWRSHLDKDFKLLCQHATHVLLGMR